MNRAYDAAFLDWLACAAAGAKRPPTSLARAVGDGVCDNVLAAGTAGHVLDFDDTYQPGLAHLSAPTAPAALVVGAHHDLTIGAVLHAYHEGFETMAATARASHPALYERGWHPTAVLGAIGAAAAVAELLGLQVKRSRTAQRLAMLSTGGLLAAFGSHGKSLQVGAAAAAGARAALLAAAGAAVPSGVTAAFERAYGAVVATPARPAITENWLKAYPCCLQTHAAIEAAAEVRRGGGVVNGAVRVVVHPRSRQAAPYDDVADGLEAKFSLPYTVAWTLLHGPPGVAAFASVEPAVRALADRVTIVVDEQLGEAEALVTCDGDGPERSARVEYARGSPQRPLTEQERADKVRALGGDRLLGIIDDPDTPARDVARTAGLRW